MSFSFFSFPKESFNLLDVINKNENYRESYFVLDNQDLRVERCAIISVPIKSMKKPNTKLVVRLRQEAPNLKRCFSIKM